MKIICVGTVSCGVERISEILRDASLEVVDNPFVGVKGDAYFTGSVYYQIIKGIPFSLIFAEDPFAWCQKLGRISGVFPCVVGGGHVVSSIDAKYNCYIMADTESIKAQHTVIRMLKDCKHKSVGRIDKVIAKEWVKQFWSLNCIASESIASEEVCGLQGSVLTNKYAEGYPKARYYSGCALVDEIEELAQAKAQKLFQCQFANVQPHSGSQANQAVFHGLMKPGDVLLGMDLAHGGHLTHGFSVNSSGKIYKGVSYVVDAKTCLIDYSDVRKKALEHRPKVIVAGASAYSRVIDYKMFREIADEVGAYLLVDMAHIAGLVAGGVLDSPIPYADVVTTTTHKTLKGPRGGMILCNDQDIYKKVCRGVFPGVQGGPLMHVVAAKAQCFTEALSPSFRRLMTRVVQGAQIMAEVLLSHDLQVLTGGTDNHQILVDLRSQGIGGQYAEDRLSQYNIFVNKNMVPFDTAKPTNPSGIRLGSMALACRGFKDSDFRKTAELVADILLTKNNVKKVSWQKAIATLCKKHFV